MTINLNFSASQYPNFVSSAVGILNSFFNTTIGENTVAAIATSVAAAAAIVFLSSQSSSNDLISNCTTANAEILKFWPARIQSVIDDGRAKWEAYNDPAIAAYKETAATADKLNGLFEKDRSAYVNFCRTNGQFKPLLDQWSEEGCLQENPWMDCKITEAKASFQIKCFEAFDSLRNDWNTVYTKRLYAGEDYVGSAISWLSHRVWKQPAQAALKSIPQQILESGLDGQDPQDAMDALSYVKPFEKDLYCKQGCAYVKTRHREAMLHVHPDKKPFPEAPTIKEADRLANEVTQLVNSAKETLCKKTVKKSLC